MLSKKILLTLAVLSCIGLVGCNNGNKNQDVHKCRLFAVDAQESTCVVEGNVEHDICIYCNTRYLDGKVVTEDEVENSISNYFPNINQIK